MQWQIVLPKVPSFCYFLTYLRLCDVICHRLTFSSWGRLSELRQQKQKLSRQVRDKEEELEVAMQKIDSLRHDIRKAEKLRRELEARVEEAMAETGKERKLRERSEEYCKQMEEETEKLRQRNLAVGTDTSVTNQAHASQEIIRLKAEVEKLEVQYNESLAQQHSRYNLEIASLRDQLQEAESRRDTLEREVSFVMCFC
jgi:serine/threonine-protein kinase MRCK